MTVEKAAVISLRDNTYYATMWVKVRGRFHEVDARPSNAVTLALRVKAPIFVKPELRNKPASFFSLPIIYRKGWKLYDLDMQIKYSLRQRRSRWNGGRFVPCLGGIWAVGSSWRRNNGVAMVRLSTTVLLEMLLLLLATSSSRAAATIRVHRSFLSKWEPAYSGVSVQAIW